MARRAWIFAGWVCMLVAGACSQAGAPQAGQLPQAPQPAPTDPAPGPVTQAQAQAVAAMPPPLDTSQMQPVQIMDANGFGQPVVAVQLQIPAGWNTTGGVVWNDATNCIANQMQIAWTAMAPDSLTAAEIMPGFNWQVAGTEIQMNPCPAAPFRSARELLMATVQRTRPGARILGYETLPEAERKMAQAAPANPQAQVRHEVGRLQIGYAHDGVAMREQLTAAVTFSSMQGNVVAGTTTINSLRAPEGRFDPGLGRRISDTMQANPQWLQAMSQRSMANLQRFSQGQRNSINDWHNRQMAIINARGAADRAAIRMRTNQEVAGIYSAIAANTSATNDRIQGRTVDAINEVNSYAGSDGSVVKSSIHGGDRVFQSNSDPGETYSTDDPYHEPADATELQPIP